MKCDYTNLYSPSDCKQFVMRSGAMKDSTPIILGAERTRKESRAD